MQCTLLLTLETAVGHLILYITYVVIFSAIKFLVTFSWLLCHQVGGQVTPMDCGLVSRTHTVLTCSQDVSATGCAMYQKQVGTTVNMPSI